MANKTKIKQKQNFFFKKRQFYFSATFGYVTKTLTFYCRFRNYPLGDVSAAG